MNSMIIESDEFGALELEECPRLDGTVKSPYYVALATDDEGSEYHVFWVPLELEEACEEGAEEYDWSSPSKILKYTKKLWLKDE